MQSSSRLLSGWLWCRSDDEVIREAGRDLGGLKPGAAQLTCCFRGGVEQLVGWAAWAWPPALPVDNEENAVGRERTPHLAERVFAADLMQQVHGEDPIGLAVTQRHAVGGYQRNLRVRDAAETVLRVRQHFGVLIDRDDAPLGDRRSCGERESAGAGAVVEHLFTALELEQRDELLAG